MTSYFIQISCGFFSLLHPNSYSMEFSFWSHTVIAVKLYTRRDSCAIVACAKFCSVFHTLKGIKVHRMWIALMKRTLIYIHLIPRENRGNPMVCKVVRCTSSPVVPCHRSLAYREGVSLYIDGCIVHKSATPTATTYTSTNPVNDLALGRSSNMYGQYSGATLDGFYIYEYPLPESVASVVHWYYFLDF